MIRVLVWCVASLATLVPALDARSDEPQRRPPQMAASLSGSTEPAAAARDAIVNEALEELKAAQASGDRTTYARPWQDMRWLNVGPGKVGRLFDLCTGAVEPPPAIAGRAADWETLDPRKLSSVERRKLVQWQAEQILAQFGCGTVFVIGTLSADARRQLPACPPRPDNGVGDVNAFIRYVDRRPALRKSDDLTGALVDALRAEGCS